MRIIYVINGTDFGGTEASLLRLAAGMRGRGHDVAVVSLKPIGRIGEELRRQQFAITSLDMSETVTPAAFVQSVRRLAQQLRHEPCEVVHAFLPRANVMSRIANRFARRAPHVSGERSLNFQRSPALVRMNRATLRWTDCVLAVSPAVHDHLVERDRVPKGKLRTITTGVDVDAVDAVEPAPLRETLALDAAQPLLCSIGRLHPVKGHTHLLRAMALLVPRLTTKLCLVLAGDGPDNDALRRQAEELGVNGQVRFLGYRDDAVAVAKACDLLVLPSLEEGLPVAALEAMAAGRPVVGSAVGGLLQLVQPGETGLLVPVGDAEALADALYRLIADPGLRQRFGAAARRAICERFSQRRMLDETEGLYVDLIRARAA